MRGDIETWEGEDGATFGAGTPLAIALHGSESQIEWAGRIRRAVAAEFDRVAMSLERATSMQSAENRRDAEAVIAILEDRGAEVMSRDEAGYFIRDWQEMGGRVRQIVIADVRYAAIKARRIGRRRLQVCASPQG